MTKFNVLPTNEDFRKLTDDQIELILFSMQEDAREIELARKGLTVDSEYYDASFEEEVWNKPPGEWEVLKEGHDADEIARQVEELTRKEDLEKLQTKFETLEEYNAYLEAGGKTARETEVEQYINSRLEEAYAKARRLEAEGKQGKLVDDSVRAGEEENLAELDKEIIDKNIALFNEEFDDDDDDYTVL